MVRIENAGAEYTSGTYSILLSKNSIRKDDLEFNLTAKEQQKLRFMFLEKVSSKTNKTDSEEKQLIEDMSFVMKDILKQSYPTQSDDWCENVNTKYGQELQLELYFIWGFRSKEAYEAMLEAQKQEIKKVKDGQVGKEKEES